MIVKVFCAIGIVAVIYFMYWTVNLTGNGCNAKGNWDESCVFIKETTYNGSLPSPKSIKPFLINFTKSAGAGKPIYLPLWYRFRYVNSLTGEYGDFSDWCDYPVVSGSCCLPCDDSCQFPVGDESCIFNQPTIGVRTSDAVKKPTSPEKDGSFVYMNLHRYVGPSNDYKKPPKSAKSVPVGVLMVPKPGYFSWTDVLFNPCGNGCVAPKICTTDLCKDGVCKH